MSDFIDQFHKLMLQEAAAMRLEDDETTSALVSYERRRLDESYETELVRRKAMVDRKLTIDFAWAAAQLLSFQHVPTDLYTRTDRRGGVVGKIGRVIQRAPKKAVTAEGWPLANWSNKYYPHMQTSTLLLTPRENEHGNHLSVLTRRFAQNSSSDLLEAQPQDLNPVGSVPLESEQVKWPVEWPNAKDGVTMQSVAYLRSTDQSIPLKDDQVKERLRAYESAGIENHVRRAIARVAARHTVINPGK